MSRIVVAIFCAVSLPLCGCSLINGKHKEYQGAVPAVPNGEASTVNEDFRADREDEMIMLNARKDMSPSHEPDKWYSDMLFSKKAQSIERSLGVQYH